MYVPLKCSEVYGAFRHRTKFHRFSSNNGTDDTRQRVERVTWPPIIPHVERLAQALHP
mgnify:CR=1 FL=1